MLAVKVAAIRAMEDSFRQKHGNAFDLMLRAGEETANFINAHCSGFRRVLFVCGKGNNAGDAFCAAAKTILPHLICTTTLSSYYSGEAALALHRYKEILNISPEHRDLRGILRPGDLIVDALLGIGYDGGEIRGTISDWIKEINQSRLPVLALDIPSGLNGDNGETYRPDSAVRAKWTITFGLPKRGMFLSRGAGLRGELSVADIGLGEVADEAKDNAINVYTINDAAVDMPDCDVYSHKKSRGKVALFAGSSRYPGAAALALSGAMHAGAGLARLFSETRPANLPNCAIFRQIDYRDASKWSEILPEISESDAAVAGPGWGNEISPEYLKKIFSTQGKLILDADGLNLLARNPELLADFSGEAIFTPHPGEAERLAVAFKVEKSSSRKDFALKLAEKLHGTVVLKGKDSVIASFDGRYVINSSGDHRLATAGSGDVLSGIIAGIFCRKSDPFASAALGVFIHGLAAEKFSGFPIADDIVQVLPECFEEIARQGVTC